MSGCSYCNLMAALGFKFVSLSSCCWATKYKANYYDREERRDTPLPHTPYRNNRKHFQTVIIIKSVITRIGLFIKSSWARHLEKKAVNAVVPFQKIHLCFF